MAEADAFEDYDDFLRASIQRYWQRKGSSKITFLALMFATRHAWPVAAKEGFSAQTGKKALTGAAGMAAAAVVIRIFLGGPLGLLLAGASAVSLIAVYGKNQEAIWKKVLRYRGLIGDYEPKFESIHAQHASGDVDGDQRDLMMEGLMGRFLDTLDEAPEEEEEVEEEKVDTSSFASHVARKTEDTDAP
ncbi:MAG: hypothetical protein AAGE52_21125 [Myxococcota bacterium]